MRKSWARALIVSSFLIQPVFAQLQFGGRFEHNRYLQFEPVTVALTVINKTGKTLVLGEVGGDTAIRFELRAAGGAYIQPRRNAPAVALLVGAGQTAVTNVNVRDYYELDKPGSYTVIPMLVTPSRTYLAPKAFLDVVPGVVAAEMELEVNGASRIYSLRTCSRDRSDDLFLRIDDVGNGVCYGVYSLGNVLRFQPPHMEVDEEDRLHVIHQPHPAYLTHHVFTLNGSLIRRASFNRSGAGDLLDDVDHLELMESEMASEPSAAPDDVPVASENMEADVLESVPGPERAAERAAVDAIMQDLERAPAVEVEAVMTAPAKPVIRPPEVIVQEVEPAPAVYDSLQEPVGR
ncbi:MAG: hypothetical protein AB7T27_03710 [Kiritimatiellia bacterium]